MTDNHTLETPAKSGRLLLIWVVASLMIPNIWLSLTENMTLIQSLTNIILPTGLYIWLISLTRKPGKTALWMIPLYVFAAFQIVLLYMYGRSPIAVDMFLNVVTTNPGEVGELLGNMMLIIFTVVLIYLPPIVAGIIAQTRHWTITLKQQHNIRISSYIILAAGALCLGLSYFSSRPYRIHCDLYPVNIFYNLESAIHRTFKVAAYDKTSADYAYNASSTRPDSVPEIYVVVIGETSRADNWQIDGYNRPTTPHLISVDGLYSFPRAISQSNTTHKSVPMLLSPLDATNFGDSIYHVKSLITAFKEAGFKTSFFSAHSRNHSFIDFFGEEADTCLFIKEDNNHSQHYYDKMLIPYLQQQIKNGNRKQLVVLHSYGSHFNYIDRFPKEDIFFKPDRPASATHNYRDKQINAYDNTIRYTSSFLAEIIDSLKSVDGYAAMIYTSDHGEDIFDDSRRLFLHASPVPSYYQIHVPMLVWINDAYRTSNPQIASALDSNRNQFVASSKAFFHTISEIAGISTPRLKPAESLANKNYTPSTAMYLNDHNDGVRLIDCGILDLDIVKLDSLRIPLR